LTDWPAETEVTNGPAQPSWKRTARPEQLPPTGDWRTWLILAGRGWGKTRTLVEFGMAQIESCPRLAIVAPTYADARDTVVEGVSGFYPLYRDKIETWNRTLGELVFTNGARAKIFSSGEPDRLRGPQHYAALCDELAAWKYPDDTWNMLMMGLRLGTNPRVCVATTPRPIPLVKQLLSAATTHITRGSTYDNRANLAPQFFDQIIARYEGTVLGRQELNAEILDDMPGALWQRAMIESKRVTKAPELSRITVAIDPSATSGGDEAGVITAGVGMCDCKGTPELHGFVLDDSSIQGSPQTWAGAAVTAYHKLHADSLVAEDNNGGEMVDVTISTIRNAPPVKRIHASRGKHTRAEPVAALYEQGKVHHVGTFAKLEDEQCSWLPGMASPNRMDALVWAITELMIGGGQQILSYYLSKAQKESAVAN
jgi:phage terminase large subunit-like protein